MDTFGKRLVYARNEKGYSQKQLAELMGITPTRLNYWEKDKREPDIPMLKKLSEILEVDSDFLIGNWPDDFYEDYRNARNDQERLYLLQSRGVPPGLRAEYVRLAGPLTNGYNLNDEEESYLIELYRRANEDDRQAVRLILRKYEDPTSDARASAG